jgi:hypothetical protein
VQITMATIEVLITFYCRTGETERLALAAAVGAVQSRANIRLRRLADVVHTGRDVVENLSRMRKEYVPPTEADLVRADAIIFAAPPGFTPAAPEWRDCLALLARLGSEGKLHGKLAAVVAEDSQTRDSLSAAVLNFGFTIPVSNSDPTLQGRHVAAAVHAAKKNLSAQ